MRNVHKLVVSHIEALLVMNPIGPQIPRYQPYFGTTHTHVHSMQVDALKAAKGPDKDSTVYYHGAGTDGGSPPVGYDSLSTTVVIQDGKTGEVSHENSPYGQRPPGV